MNILYLLMALAGGAGLAVQAAVNSRLSNGFGNQPLVASFISFTVGAICLGVMAATRADWSLVWPTFGAQAWWRWTGGVLGGAFVFTSVFLVPRLGVANTMFLFIIGQLITSMAIDGFGLIQMPVKAVHWWKYAGMGVMLAGLVLFVFGDRLFLLRD